MHSSKVCFTNVGKEEITIQTGRTVITFLSWINIVEESSTPYVMQKKLSYETQMKSFITEFIFALVTFVGKRNFKRSKFLAVGRATANYICLSL